MPDFDFDQTGEARAVAPHAYGELSRREKLRVDELVRRMRRRQMNGEATTTHDLIGFTQSELDRLLPVARARMNVYTFRQDNFDASVTEEIARETLGGDLPDDRAVELAVAAASGLIPSDAHIVAHLLAIGIPSSVLARTWDRIKARLGAHTAAKTRMPEVAA